VTFLATIPSPHSGTIDVGPFSIHLYGVMLLLAIAACVALTGYRWVKWGGDWDLVFRVAVWGVAFGIVGARLYHDVTSWNEVQDLHAWWAPFAVWKGGLGVWGGILFGVLAGAWIVHRSGQSVRLFMDAVAPGLLLAQGIGRWGNWFNQELFGKPTDLPWGLRIDAEHQASLPAKYLNAPGYHPTFLYEFIYDLLGVIVLLLVDRYFKIRRPALFALYVSIYTFGRFFEELLRIDPAHEFLGLRLNAWVSIVMFVLSTAFFIWWQFIRQPSGTDRPRARRTVPEGPAMAVPKGRVRSGR
jgi:phosphatidylglycerol---prolipoprotein diacylglyceryl transferase